MKKQIPGLSILKKYCKGDLFYLTKVILGYPDLNKETHLEVCRFFENETIKRKISLLPRGSFKTTIGTIANSIQRILRNPDIRILIFSETYNQAKKFLSEIKKQLERNEKLIALFGEFTTDPGWREEEITIRQRKGIFKEPTIMTGGVDVVRVGFHYNLIIVDDPHSQKNIATRDQLEKVKETFRLLLPMLEPDGELVFNGTRWHFADLASLLLEDKKFAKLIKAAEDEKGNLWFPQRLSRQWLDEQRNSLGSYLYSCLYLNNPIDDEKADFKKSWLKYYKDQELEKQQILNFITIDLAFSKKDTADYLGIIVNSVDTNNNWYIRQALKLRINPAELIDRIFELYQMWRPVKIGMEKEKYSLVIKHFLDEEMRKRNIFPPIEELKVKIANKEMRIRGLIPRFERGTIYLKEEMIDLVDELLRFPKAVTDDLSDALSFQLDIASPPFAIRKREWWEKPPEFPEKVVDPYE